MDPVEAGEWLGGRPQQLLFLTGLDPCNKKSHSLLVSSFGNQNRSSDRPPLNLRTISGELDIPQKRDKLNSKGILRRDWPQKYLERVPSLIVLFLDLDWDHPSWPEKKTEAESKCASIRASCRHGSKLAVVLLQDRSLPTPADDPLATERAHELCQTCQLTPKQLFVLPVLGDLQGYVLKLENAFHELAQGFYQQRLKTIRARSIPNNSPSLVVRQLFKLAFLSELRQDTHTALRNYRLAYEHCKDNVEHWDGIDIYEWRSVVGLLNYKVCELCFLHSTAVEAINQMRKHHSTYFNSSPGLYPTPSLASIEHGLWKAKQSWHFAQLFEQAVSRGLTALATLNPGTHLGNAASIYSSVNKEIAFVKSNTVVPSGYPSPDPLATATVYFGQRPWRVGYDGLTPQNIEEDAVNAILQRLVVNHEGVISLLTAARAQFSRYGCIRMQKKIMNEMATVYYESGDCAKALQLWQLVVRDGLPTTVKLAVLQKATWAAYSTASIKEFVWCCLQLAATEPAMDSGLQSILRKEVPAVPFTDTLLAEEQAAAYAAIWQKTLSEPQSFTVNASRIDSFLSLKVSFLSSEKPQRNDRVPMRVELTSKSVYPLMISKISIFLSSLLKRKSSTVTTEDSDNVLPIELHDVDLPANSSITKVAFAQLSALPFYEGDTIVVDRIILNVGDKHSSLSCRVEWEGSTLTSSSCFAERSIGTDRLTIAALGGGIVTDGISKIDCLVGEVAEVQLPLKNTTSRTVKNIKLEFKRNEQASTAAAAVLFVDAQNELRSELVVECGSTMESNQLISIPLRFSAQLVGEMELLLEASYFMDSDATSRRSCRIPLSVQAREPFSVTSGALTMNGIPITSLLNHNEHMLKADITSHADIVITSVEWLMADVVEDLDIEDPKEVNDALLQDDVMSYMRVVKVDTREEDVEMPLGRLALEWKRPGSSTAVRSVVALCRLPVLSCPVLVTVNVLDSPAVVRQPIRLQYSVTSRTNEAIQLTVSFDLADPFMFCGDKKLTFRLLPGSCRTMNVVVMALTGGRLPFPKTLLKSPEIADSVLAQTLRSLPATLFVLPHSKDGRCGSVSSGNRSMMASQELGSSVTTTSSSTED